KSASTSSTVTPFEEISREDWARLSQQTPLPLSEEDVAKLRGLGDRVDLIEVDAVYRPISRLLDIQFAAALTLRSALESFLDHHGPPAARADGALAGHPAGPAGDHRRLPPPQRGARGARDDAAQGLPRELRPARPAALRGGCEGRARARRGAGLLAPDLRHP